VDLTERYPESRESNIARARLALAENRPHEAAQIVAPLIAEAETSELQRLRALAEYRLGNIPEAREAIDRSVLLASQPHYPSVRLRARIAHDGGDWKETVRMIRLLGGRGQEISDAELVMVATALHRSGDRDGGVEVLNELLAKEPPSPEAAVAFAELEGAEQPEAVHAVILRTWQAAPGHIELLEVLTESEVGVGKAKQALERLNTVVAAGRATPRVLQLRARTLAGLGAYEEAEADLLRAFEANPSLPGAIDFLYSIYEVQGRLEEARRSFEQADEAGVLHSGARLLLARLYLGEGNSERARDTLRQVVEERPDLWGAKNDLAWLLAERGEDLEQALVLAREAHDASGRLAATADTVGWVHYKAGRAEASLQYFRRAIRIANQRTQPLSPSFRYHAGLALDALGRDDEAAQAFEKALALGEFPEADDARERLEAARHREPESDPERPS